MHRKRAERDDGVAVDERKGSNALFSSFRVAPSRKRCLVFFVCLFSNTRTQTKCDNDCKSGNSIVYGSFDERYDRDALSLLAVGHFINISPS